MHRILIIGTGSIGERHLRCLLATGRVMAGVVEVNPALRQDMASRYAVTALFDSLEAALQEEWSAAVIATPAPTHIPMARQLVEAGIHLLIEKPLATNLTGVAELANLVRDRQLMAGVAYVYRAIPCLAAMRAAIVSGRFGKPVEIVAMAGQSFPHYRPAYREIYYRDRAQGGGAIQDALTHVFNAGEWLVGPIERICVDAAHLALPGVTVEDTVHALTRQGAVLGVYALNQHQAPNENTLTVVCERGTVRCELAANRWSWVTQPGGEWQVETSGPVERDQNFVRQAEAFLDALDGRGAPLCSLAEGIQTLRVNLAALESADTGKGWVVVQ
ncbi:MAG: Inositol 2-dehydrogenase/D-chiro-inositol 3-dehydrogenase [Verrucomicrobiae bacterium]|nr:Inositol 2-dehydrogenase/D-chiro-inositol 3-dehydrogenase [Verrucomicrobiae bacterium]